MEYGPLTHEISYSPALPPCKSLPKNTRESEGQCSEAWSRGRPLVSAKRAASPSAEGGREFQREGGNASQCMVPSLSLRIKRRRQRPRLVVQELEIVRLRLPRPIGHQR